MKFTNNSIIVKHTDIQDQNILISDLTPGSSIPNSEFLSYRPTQRFKVTKTTQKIQELHILSSSPNSVTSRVRNAFRHLAPRRKLANDFIATPNSKTISEDDQNKNVSADRDLAEEIFLQQEGFQVMSQNNSQIRKPDVLSPSSVVNSNSHTNEEQSMLEELDLENFNQNTFWAQRSFGTTFEEYLDATAKIIGKNNVVSFNAEERGRVEITVKTPEDLDLIIQKGIDLDGMHFKTYRLAEKPTQITIHGIPPIIPHTAVCNALRLFGKASPSDCSFVFAPVVDPGLKHIKSCRRRVWVRTTSEIDIPNSIVVEYAGKALNFRISHGQIKCFSCGKIGHFRSACRVLKQLQSEKIPENQTESQTDQASLFPTYAESVKFDSQRRAQPAPQVEKWGMLGSGIEQNIPISAPLQSNKLVNYANPSRKKTSVQVSRNSAHRTTINSKQKTNSNINKKSVISSPTSKLKNNTFSRNKQVSREIEKPFTPSVITEESECLQLASAFLDALEEKNRGGCFSSGALESVDVQKALDLITNNRKFFEANTNFESIEQFISEASEVQNNSKMQVDMVKSATKRHAPESDDLSSVVSTRARSPKKADRRYEY